MDRNSIRRGVGLGEATRRQIGYALATLLCVLTGPSMAIDPASDIDALQAPGWFFIDGETHSTVSALAWSGTRSYGQDEFRVFTIGFYPFAFTERQVESAAAGRYGPIDEQVRSDTQSVNYKSHVKIIILIGDDDQVLQVDLSAPGYFCTIAPFEEEIAAFFGDFRLEGNRLHLSSDAAYKCHTRSPDISNTAFAWRFNVDLPIFAFDDR